MSKIIGVEESLSNVEAVLAAKGYEVKKIRSEEDVKNCDCCVISGQDENVMGISNVVSEGSVINARGLSADEICQRVEKLLH
ncbi:YkuS family protein [Lysinibacillus endophyticus]|uniref:UPF0180 protein D8M03_15415 n=1 Tax=Ureibacillus endophyticus TaxID=1978490 RepID=A0A494YUV0_9BACL|nr:YkuS family protein [Lysinibacillus endophyticus]RKQ13780.1 YkuS family protein [Lysinibacillus endophyticus]